MDTATGDRHGDQPLVVVEEWQVTLSVAREATGRSVDQLRRRVQRALSDTVGQLRAELGDPAGPTADRAALTMQPDPTHA